MKVQSRILTIILSLTLVLPWGMLAAASDAAQIPSVADNKYYNMLVSFGIIDEADGIENEQYITRSQFAKYAVSLFGPKVVSVHNENTELPFEDIGGDTNINSIMELYNRGMLSGTAPGQFSPDSEVTMGQAAKVFVTALGYERLALFRGGYPTGYVTVAGRLDILDGVSADVNKPIEVFAFVRMLFNALNADVVQLVGIAQSEDEFFEISNAYSGVSVLKKHYDIYKYEGILDSNEYTSLNGPTDLSERIVSINSIAFNIGNTDAYNLLGYAVECYYTNSDEEIPTLLYTEIDEKRNEINTADGADVNKDALTLTKFSYYDNKNGRNYNLKLSSVAVLIYNGQQQELSTTYMCPANGDVTLIDNNSDNAIDVIKVMDYRTMYVTAVSDASYTLSGEGGITIELKPDEKEYGVYITGKNAEMQFSEISAGNIVSYALPLSLTSRYMKYIQVSDRTVEGAVYSIDNVEKTAMIDSVEYRLLPGQSIKAGDAGTFYLDYKNAIARCTKEKDFVYGYLFGIGKKGAFGSVVEAKLLSEKGNLVTLSFCDKIKTNSGLEKAVDFYTANSTRKNELVRYSVATQGENEGKIKELYLTTGELTVYSDAHMAAAEAKTFHRTATIETETYYSSAATFDGLVNFLPETIIFMLPDNKTVDTADEEDFDIVTNSVLLNNQEYTNIMPYDVDESGNAAAVIMQSMSEYASSSGLVPVEKVMMSINADGEFVYRVSGYFSGSEVMSVCVKNDNTLQEAAKSLKRGDVIRCSINAENEIIKLNRHFTKEEAGDKKLISNNIYGSSALASGTVEAIDYEKMKIVLDSGTKNSFSIDSVSNVWIYDSEEDAIQTAKTQEVRKGDKILIRAGNFVAREIVIYR